MCPYCNSHPVGKAGGMCDRCSLDISLRTAKITRSTHAEASPGYRHLLSPETRKRLEEREGLASLGESGQRGTGKIPSCDEVVPS